MTPRRYNLGKRASSTEQTRARVLKAARDLLAHGGFTSMSVDEVARRADVARATVYYQFRSKSGLLEAVVQDIQRRAGQAQIVQAVDTPDPVQALREAFIRGSRFWASEHQLVGKLIGLAAIDPDVRHALASVEGDRLPLLEALVERLHVAGRLSRSCPPQRAIDVLWMLSSFEAFDQLHTGRHLPVDQAANVLANIAVRQLTD
jgi:AcrR family transcriptional regulator